LQTGGQGPIATGDPQDNAIAVIGMLIQAGADVNARISDTSSRTAIIARPSSMTDRQGQTAIYGAISQNWTRVAKYLIEQGARVDIKDRSEEHTSELQSRENLVCRLLLEKKNLGPLVDTQRVNERQLHDHTR